MEDKGFIWDNPEPLTVVKSGVINDAAAGLVLPAAITVNDKHDRLLIYEM